MKKIFSILLIVVSMNAFSQCETRNSAGSLSLHYSGGYGGELGQQGLLSNSSFFLGIDVRKQRTIEGNEVNESFIYGKIVQRFMQSSDERFEIGVSIAPGFYNTEFDCKGGVRLLYVVGRNAAVSIEPNYRISNGVGGFLNIHFLL
jgi:hypothetical protein